MDEVLTIALIIEDVLDRLGVRHVVGGSLASSLHGIPRATQDIDFVVDLRPADADVIVAELAPRFYVDEHAVKEAIRERTRFNAIHLETMFKAHVYVPAMDEVMETQLACGSAFVVDERTGRTLVVSSAEDAILQKLRWYRLGEEVSERQWKDALGVLRVQGGRLDREYLERTADRLRVRDLLDQARRASGNDPQS